MMAEPIIEVKNLSKRYVLGMDKKYKRLTESITNTITHPIQAIKRVHMKKEEFWALKNVSFTVNEGDIVGVIGRNGAGKSTLLKILSQITYPTTGEATLHGKVGSLLEVGTGFHPELTGRENIYMNGAILGMRRKEIDDKFDDIVKFSEVEKFLETPVKRYSSGMYVRLAFAVAANLETEILLIDEVLAVGDVQFQKKCLGKMKTVSESGRTLLFVSHNLQAVSQLCSRTILLDKGRLIGDGSTQEILNTYTTMVSHKNNLNGDLSDPKLRLSISKQDSLFKWTDIMMINSEKQPTSEIRFGEPFEVIFRGYGSKTSESVIIGFAVISKISGPIFSTHQLYNGLPDTLPEGISEFHIKMDPNILAPGFYEIFIAASGPRIADYIPVSLEFDVLPLGITPEKSWHTPHQVGVVDYPCKWSVKFPSCNMGRIDE